MGAANPAPDATREGLSRAYGQLPLSFEPNRGQANPGVDFVSHGAGYSLTLTSGGARLALGRGDRAAIIGMRVVGSNPTARSVALGRQAGTSNYLIGRDPSRWRTRIPNYGQVRYHGVYRGIDLVYHGSRRQLEYDFVVRPGASPRTIRLAFGGTQGRALDTRGNLVLHTSGGDVVEHAPVAYQDINGVRHAVASRFVVGPRGGVGFRVGSYDHSKPLVIDPTLGYSTYLGGSSSDDGYAIAVDGDGNAYITGDTASTDFPTRNPLKRSNSGGGDVFVTELNAAGTALVYSTFLGGRGYDVGRGIAVNSSKEVYITGQTSSTNFPIKNGAQTTNGGSPELHDAFVAKLNAQGTALVYSTYLGGGAVDAAHGIAVDGGGNAYVTGETRSTDFPTANPYQSTLKSDTDAFVAKIDPRQTGASSLIYSTYLDGTMGAKGTGIAVDGDGNAYVTGGTLSSDFPTAGTPFQATLGGGWDAFVTKLNASGSGLVYSTYLGGSTDDRAFVIALDNAHNAYVTGQTTSPDFPTSGAYQSALSGGADAFVTKLNPAGSALVYSTYLGGSSTENAYANPIGGIAVDGNGYAYVTGSTNSTDFPTTASAFQGTSGGGEDAFVTKLGLDGSTLVYSSYLGGSDWEKAFGIAVDGSGNAYVTGATQSGNFPLSNPFQPRKGGRTGYDAFVSKISAN